MSFLSAREKTGLTQKEVAERLGIDQSSVSLWETGKTAPRVAVLVKLAELYHCSLDELLSRESPVRSPPGDAQNSA